jgi:hypothetical protein
MNAFAHPSGRRGARQRTCASARRTIRVERTLASYADVVTDPEVEVVYNPLANALHGQRCSSGSGTVAGTESLFLTLLSGARFSTMLDTVIL